MPSFTTESMVRLRFQLQDTASVPADLVEAAIDDAHAELLARLGPAYAEPPWPQALVLGETLLAGANVYRALAAKDAHDQKHVVVGGQRVEADSVLARSRPCPHHARRGLAPARAVPRDHPRPPR